MDSRRSSPRRSTYLTDNDVDDEPKTMAYFLKDRPEGIPMASYSPSKRPRSQRPEPNTRPQRSISRIVAPKLKLVDGKVVVEEQPSIDTIEDLTAGMTVVRDESTRFLTSATYSKRRTGANRWSLKETDLFYEALSMCGTDFSMISALFPHRNRQQIKGKYKIEERNAPHRVSVALATKKPLDKAAFAAKLGKVMRTSSSLVERAAPPIQ